MAGILQGDPDRIERCPDQPFGGRRFLDLSDDGKTGLCERFRQGNTRPCSHRLAHQIRLRTLTFQVCQTVPFFFHNASEDHDAPPTLCVASRNACNTWSARPPSKIVSASATPCSRVVL